MAKVSRVLAVRRQVPPVPPLPKAAIVKRAEAKGEKAEGTELALTEEQRAVLDIICSGLSVVDAATEVKVSRTTIYRWMKTDLAFQLAYNQWADEMQQAARARVVAMTDVAARALENALTAGNGSLALALLSKLGLTGVLKTPVTDAGEMKKRAEMEARRRQLVLEKEERSMELDHEVAKMNDRDLAGVVEEDKQKVKLGKPPAERKVTYSWTRGLETPAIKKRVDELLAGGEMSAGEKKELRPYQRDGEGT